MSETAEPEFDGTIQFLSEIHQDVIDDSMVNPVPIEVARIISRVYGEASKQGQTVVQWRITFGPYPVDEMREIGRSDADIAWMRRRRVVKMTAHTAGGSDESVSGLPPAPSNNSTPL
jgi:hypothetical protein